jgi:hypothetical protein
MTNWGFDDQVCSRLPLRLLFPAALAFFAVFVHTRHLLWCTFPRNGQENEVLGIDDIPRTYDPAQAAGLVEDVSK